VVLWLVVPGAAALLLLLLWVTFEPWISRWVRGVGRAPAAIPEAAAAEPAAYRSILVPLDQSSFDRLAVGHAVALARLHGAAVHLLHVEEGVTSQVYGTESSTAEVEAGAAYLERMAEALRGQGITVETAISHSSSPRREIVRHAREIGADLLIMGAHGHRRLKDIIFGATIDGVRHDLDIPVLIVRAGKT
jgi:manganese transport protein